MKDWRLVYGSIICYWQGHKRGVRDDTIIVNMGEQGYRCPRCGTVWARKMRKARA